MLPNGHHSTSRWWLNLKVCQVWSSAFRRSGPPEAGTPNQTEPLPASPMPVQYKDYYKTLGVPRTASDAEIKRAFRKLAREYHPDVAKDKKQAEEKFKEVNEAYEVLGDAAKRKRYDELGADWSSGAEFRPPPGWGSQGGRTYRSRGPRGEDSNFEFGGTGFSDFFEQIFGST